MSSRHWKMALLALLLVALGWGFGLVCRRIASSHLLLTPPFRGFARSLLWLQLVLMAMPVGAGLVVVLLSPRRVAYLAFLASGLAMWSAWGWTLRNALFSLLYALAGVLYAALTQSDLRRRLDFSVRPVSVNWWFVSAVLVLVVPASFYLGLCEHAQTEGLALPEQQLDVWTSDLAEGIVAGTPLSILEGLRREGTKQVQQVLKNQAQSLARRVERFVPPVAAAGLFLVLLALTWMLWWVPMMVLHLAFALMVALGVVEMRTETREAERLFLR